nr:zf-TFIIB domain-containing protein [uncultured Holophaga sp.]
MEAKVMRCASCGAQVGEDDVQCPYCRSQLATVSCPHCFGMVSLRSRYCHHCGTQVEVLEQVEGSDYHCPGCSEKLLNTPVGGLDLLQCPGCAGIWLARERFEDLAKVRADRNLALPGEAAGLAALPAKTEPVRYRKCPVCSKFMNRVNYARISGIILDSCRDHGLWFDRDELRQVLAFVDGGGLDKARARERMKLEEERRQAQSAVAMQGSQGGLGMGGDFSECEGRLGYRSGSILADLVLGAATTLWRHFRP